MASVGHIAIGVAAARAQRDADTRWPALAVWSALSLLPDADVIAFAFGIPYEAPWGHRGATHSFAFALAVGAIVGLAAPWFGRRRLRTGAIAGAVVASHALLDTLTDGGLGCALFWPFDLTRYFAPWRPIPVSPIGLAFLSPQGAVVTLIELILFAPVVVLAFRRPRARLVLWPLWAAAVWLIGSTDPVRDRLLGVVLREDTEFASGYSEAAFRQFAPGDSQAHVRQRVGPPLGEWWDYPITPANPCPFVYAEGGVVSSIDLLDVCRQHGISAGMSLDAVREKLGVPSGVCWKYSRAGGSGRAFRGRAICFVDGAVQEVLRDWLPSG